MIRVQSVEYRSSQHKITWAGDCPWTGNLCFGTECGRVLFLQEQGVKVLDPDPPLTELINDIAFADRTLAIATVNECLVTGDPFKTLSGGGFSKDYRVSCGVHAIRSNGSNLFLAPAGITGMIILDVNKFPDEISSQYGQGDPPLYCYQSAYLGRNNTDELFLIACRRDGFGFANYNSQTNHFGLSLYDSGSANSVGHDVVSVCSLADSSHPYASLALLNDGRMLISNNILKEAPVTLEAPGFARQAYTIVRTQDHLALLTSSSLIIIEVSVSDLLQRLAFGQVIDLPFHEMPIDAVELFSSETYGLLIVRDDGVLAIPVPSLIQSIKGVKHSSSLFSMRQEVCEFQDKHATFSRNGTPRLREVELLATA